MVVAVAPQQRATLAALAVMALISTVPQLVVAAAVVAVRNPLA